MIKAFIAAIVRDYYRCVYLAESNCAFDKCRFKLDARSEQKLVKLALQRY